MQRMQEFLRKVSRYGSLVTTIALAVLTLIALFLFNSELHISTECTAQPAADADPCLVDSGHFRAGEFTMQTSHLDYETETAASGTTELAQDNEKRAFHQVGVTITSNDRFKAAQCATDHDAATETAACNLEKFPANIYTTLNPRKSASLAGGVHIVFFLWLACHLSVLFSLMTGTTSGESFGFAYTRLMLSALWLVFGLLFPMLLYQYDHYFHWRLPLNNVVIAYILQFYTFMLMYSWTMDRHTASPVEGKYVAMHNVKGVKSLMAMPGTIQEWGQEIKDAILSLTESKFIKRQGMEVICFELSLVMPSVLIALYGICTRHALDYEVQSIFVRSFVGFMVFGITSRMMSLASAHKDEKLGRSNVITTITSTVLVNTVMMLYLLYDVCFPAMYRLRDSQFFGAYTYAILLFILFVALIALIMLYITHGAFVDICSKSAKMDPHVTYWILGNGLIFMVRIVVLIMFWNIGGWYGHFDQREVVLNYI